MVVAMTNTRPSDAPELFADRTDAGRQLAMRMGRFADRAHPCVVYGLARGGVPVAAEVARILRWPLELIVVRKLGAPANPEVAVGAIARGVRVIDAPALASLGVDLRDLQEIEQAERRELTRREQLYLHGRAPVDVSGRAALLIDDGIATGLTMQAAVRAIRARRPARLIVAAPVAAADTFDRLVRMPEVDECVCVLRAPHLISVGMWYRDFAQVNDAEVMRALQNCAHSVS